MPILSRRAFAGAGVVALAGAAGVAAEFLRHPRGARTASGAGSTSAPPSVQPPLLPDALLRERALLARLDDAARTTPALAPTITILRADHRAHADALAALIAEAATSPSGSRATAVPSEPATGRPVTLAVVTGWEKAGAASTGRSCAAATGPAAAVLASIYACEQTHVAWLG